jgi:Immunoglobulin I-set domain
VPRTPESTPEPNTVKPEIKKALSPSAEIRQGQVLSLETIIQAPPQSEVQWLKNGNVLVANVKILLGREPSGAQPNTSKHFLVIKNPEPSDQGICQGTNGQDCPSKAASDISLQSCSLYPSIERLID